MSIRNGPIRRILHVEDNPGDVSLIGAALGESGRDPCLESLFSCKTNSRALPKQLCHAWCASKNPGN
jgi:hypothetical protein